MPCLYLILSLQMTNNLLGGRDGANNNVESNLMFFKLVMRLKENLSTSELAQVGSMIDDERLGMTLGCRAGSLPMSYLGLPWGPHFTTSLIWNGMVSLEKWSEGWLGGKDYIGYSKFFVSLEGCLETKGSYASGFLFVDSCS